MRRFTIGSALVLALLLMLSTIAMAAPPSNDWCGEDGTKPDHPSCSDTTTTTTTAQPPEVEACNTHMAIAGKGNTAFECLWTPSNNGATVAEVTVSGLHGAVKSPPVVFVRDDAPGDICVLETEWEGQTGPDYVASFDLAYDTVPVGYEAWLGETYWTLMYESEYVPGPPVLGAYWCSPQDPVLESIRFDTNGTPLHLAVSFNAKGGGGLDITLSPPQE